jgi:hypothetical protein
MATTKARQTGTLVTLTTGDDAAWMLTCEKHDLCCQFDSKREARSFAASPIEWCQGCGDEWAARQAVTA